MYHRPQYRATYQLGRFLVLGQYSKRAARRGGLTSANPDLPWNPGVLRVNSFARCLSAAPPPHPAPHTPLAAKLILKPALKLSQLHVPPPPLLDYRSKVPDFILKTLYFIRKSIAGILTNIFGNKNNDCVRVEQISASRAVLHAKRWGNVGEQTHEWLHNPAAAIGSSRRLIECTPSSPPRSEL